MKHSPAILALAAVASIPAPAQSAATRNFGITGFDRIRVDGPYDVQLTTGIAPFARAKGATSSSLDNVSIRVEGRTLIIRKSASLSDNDGRGTPVQIELGTHELSAAWINGAGSIRINKVKGAMFDLSVVGAGAAMVGTIETDQVKLTVAGSGTARVAGKTNKVNAVVRGSSTLDAESITAKEADIGAEGPSLVRMTVTETAKINAVGLSSINLQGKPSCTIKTEGSASVSGCR